MLFFILPWCRLIYFYTNGCFISFMSIMNFIQLFYFDTNPQSVQWWRWLVWSHLQQQAQLISCSHRLIIKTNHQQVTGTYRTNSSIKASLYCQTVLAEKLNQVEKSWKTTNAHILHWTIFCILIGLTTVVSYDLLPSIFPGQLFQSNSSSKSRVWCFIGRVMNCEAYHYLPVL